VFDNYPIQSINDTIVLIDNSQSTVATAGRGYFITSGGTITTYFRNPTIPTNLITNLAANTLLNAPAIGTVSSYLTYSGGWNTGTTTQDGLTVVQSCNSTNILQLNSFQAVENFGLVRGVNGFTLVAARTSVNLTNCFSIGSSNVGFNYAQNILNTSMNNLGANTLTNCCSNNAAIGMVTGGVRVIATSCKAMNNLGQLQGPAGFNAGGTNTLFKSCEASNNLLNGFFTASGSNVILRDCTAKSNGNFNTGVGAGIDIAQGGGQTFL
jgi:hypothetical protein